MSEPSKPHFSGAFDRLLYLRTLPLFGTLPSEDLALLATYTTERQFEPGALLAAEVGRVEAIHLIVDGSVRTSRGGAPIGLVGPRDTVGVLGLLSRADSGVEAVTITATRSLEIGADALLDLFEDHFTILQHVLRSVAALVLDKRRQILLAGAPEPGEDAAITSPRPLDFVERIFFLRRAMPPGFTSVAALAGSPAARPNSASSRARSSGIKAIPPTPSSSRCAARSTASSTAEPTASASGRAYSSPRARPWPARPTGTRRAPTPRCSPSASPSKTSSTSSMTTSSWRWRCWP